METQALVAQSFTLPATPVLAMAMLLLKIRSPTAALPWGIQVLVRDSPKAIAPRAVMGFTLILMAIVPVGPIDLRIRHLIV